jgi:hypothetical protein
LYQAKCPLFRTHKKYLKAIASNPDLSMKDLFKKINSAYYKQMQFELFVTGREYNVFNSFHPRLPEIDLIIERDEEMITDIEERLDEAKQEVAKEIEFINSLTIK